MRLSRNLLLLRLTAVTVWAVVLLCGNAVAQDGANETSTTTTEAPAATPAEETTATSQPTQSPVATAPAEVICPFCPNGTHIQPGWEDKIAGGYELDGVCKTGYCTCAQAEEDITTTLDPETGECKDASDLHGMCNCVSVDGGAGALSVATAVVAMAVGFLTMGLGF